MKKLQLAILLAPLAAGYGARADQDFTNRLTLSARFGFNISARFKGVSGLTAPAAGSRNTPRGDAYNYDDGYLLADSSGNFGGQSWYWGYDDSTRQVFGNSILLSRNAFSGSSKTVSADGDPALGFELAYTRPLGAMGQLKYGFEAAGNYLNISLRNTRPTPASVSRVTDAYAFTPGTTPPEATPSNPYQGSYDGNGFLVSDTPSPQTSAIVANGASIVGHRDFDANVWGLRLGPALEYPISRRFKLAASGGLAAAWIDADASWSEAAQISGVRGPALTGSGHGSDFLWGFYVSGTATYDLTERWSLVGGAQYQFLDQYQHTFGGRSVVVDFSQTILVTLGVGFNF
jgi:hypothetical protein